MALSYFLHLISCCSSPFSLGATVRPPQGPLSALGMAGPVLSFNTHHTQHFPREPFLDSWSLCWLFAQIPSENTYYNLRFFRFPLADG